MVIVWTHPKAHEFWNMQDFFPASMVRHALSGSDGWREGWRHWGMDGTLKQAG